MKISNTAINKVGDIIRKRDNTPEYDKAIETLNIWRESHGKVLDKYFDQCVKLCQKIDKNIIVAQRLKRLPTIIGKLNRFPTMRLSSMQDIAGIRIIAEDIPQLKSIEKHIKRWANLNKIDNYIRTPKDSGYRSEHFVFKKDNMFVEIQLRTQIQHLWATAVETTDIFRASALKEKDDKTYWHDFFCQTSSIFAIAEKQSPIHQYSKMSINEICNKLAANMKRNSIHSKILSFALVNPVVDIENTHHAYYFLIKTDFINRETTAVGFKESDYNTAFTEYQKLEQEKSYHQQYLLLAMNQIKKLHDAYPNYFMDLTKFIDTINYILEKNIQNNYNKTNEYSKNQKTHR